MPAPAYWFEEIGVGKLNVDETNFRTGDAETRRDAYHAMIEEQKQDLISLADDIIQNGLSPAERFIVAPDPDEEGSYVVHEGNRRITALKLLEDPGLAAGTSVERAFRRLSPRYIENPIRAIHCVIMKDKDEALPWIQRKHQTMAGRGISPWGAQAQARAEEYLGRVRPSKAVLDHLRTNGLLPSALDTRLARRTTNLDRVFQMPYLRTRLGITIRQNGDIAFAGDQKRKGANLLLDMVKAIGVEGFTVNRIRSAEQRQDFIDEFADRALGDDDSPRDAKSTSNGAQTETRRRQPSSLDRKSLALAGKANVLTVKERRLNRLYGEALLIVPDRTPNSSALLMRVFLELSADHYISEFRLPLPRKYLKKKKANWSDVGITLNDKLAAVLQSLDPTGHDHELAEARRGVSGDNYLHSVNTLHQYVHNLRMDAEGKEMKRVWERWHPFLARLFKAVSERKP
jgi:hypothetical protein